MGEKEQVGKSKEMIKLLKEENELIEGLASIEHERWSHWTEYFIYKVYKTDVKKLKSVFEKWIKQAKTPYEKLSLEDKEKDKVWARKVLTFLVGWYEEKNKTRR